VKMIFDPEEQHRSQSSYDVRDSMKKTWSPPSLISGSSSSSLADDSSDLSSISSDESFEPRRRSIFSPEMSDSLRQESITQDRTDPCPFSLDSDAEHDEDHKDQGENAYERALSRRDGLQPTRETSLCGLGKGIFGGCIQKSERRKSFFDMLSSPLSGITRRHAFSDSALVTKDLQSCLKQSKLSRQRSVSFATAVAVIDYEIDKEQFATPGWSQYFH